MAGPSWPQSRPTRSVLGARAWMAEATRRELETILDRSEREQDYSVEVDLERSEVRDSFGLQEPFTIDAASRQRLLEGKDEIDLILTHESDIAAYERRVPTL